jgi:hypothetical protein
MSFLKITVYKLFNTVYPLKLILKYICWYHKNLYFILYTKGHLTKTKWLSILKRKGRDLLKSRDILTSSFFLTMTYLAMKPFIVKGESDEKN